MGCTTRTNATKTELGAWQEQGYARLCVEGWIATEHL